MNIPIFQIDAFASKVFAGNPAAICPLENWIDDSVMQSIAMENNLSETAFFVAEKNRFHIRWFTPTVEVDLCGHATLAAAFVIFNYLDKSKNKVTFYSRSGELVVEKSGDLLSMNFPSQKPKPCKAEKNLIEGLNIEPVEILSSEDYFVVFQNEEEVRNLIPDLNRLKNIDLRGVIVTAKGDEADFVSRFFAPKFGINEDPVTGSAHCALIPFWAKKLKKDSLYGRQISKRGGEIYCVDKGERVIISGRAVKYMEGKISLKNIL